MKKVTTISLAVAAMLVCAAGARVVSAAERTSSEQDYKIVKTNNADKTRYVIFVFDFRILKT